MCGRFVRKTPIDVLLEWFEVEKDECALAPSYNIAPSQEIAAIIDDGARKLVCLRWGLIPFWAKDPAIGNRMINARSETVADKPSFRTALRKQRCLIPADGYYEWRKDSAVKIPVYFTLKSGEPFAMAGLYEQWLSPEGEEIRTCTIITTEANEMAEQVHHRMPVIVPRQQQALWLDPGVQESDKLKAILQPYPAEAMTCYEVSRLVNSPKNNSPACIEPVQERII